MFYYHNFFSDMTQQYSSKGRREKKRMFNKRQKQRQRGESNDNHLEHHPLLYTGVVVRVNACEEQMSRNTMLTRRETRNRDEGLLTRKHPSHERPLHA